jgi:hypothetical protein
MKTAYRSGAFGITEPEHRPGKQVRAISLAVAAVVTAGAVWAGYAAWAAFQGRNSPSCSWPLRIRGTATSEQSGVVRCYLQALAKRDTTGLRVLLTITFANGISEKTGIQDMIAMGGPSAWRVQIGTVIDPG